MAKEKKLSVRLDDLLRKPIEPGAYMPPDEAMDRLIKQQIEPQSQRQPTHPSVGRRIGE